MQRLYGADWRALLEEQQAAAEEEEGVDEESVTGGERSAGASVVSASAASAGRASPATSLVLRQSLLEESDVGAETTAEHRQRMDMVIDQLESLGDPVSPLERRKVTFRREYCEQIVGKPCRPEGLSETHHGERASERGELLYAGLQCEAAGASRNAGSTGQFSRASGWYRVVR